MALAPLATVADLDARGITSTFPQVDTFLDVASSVVRQAAGVNISRTTSTVVVSGWGDRWVNLPGAPVVSVATVEVDGTVVDDWKLADGRLYRDGGWSRTGGPVDVEVAYTHGLDPVPAFIVDLVCNMVAAAKLALDADPEGLGLAVDNGSLQSVSIDGFSESYATAGDSIAATTVMTLPSRTRQWLRDEFGGTSSLAVR